MSATPTLMDWFPCCELPCEECGAKPGDQCRTADGAWEYPCDSRYSRWSSRRAIAAWLARQDAAATTTAREEAA